MKTEEIIPSAARLTNSLRDLGYGFVNAVADLIDNSISAAATRVNITISFQGANSWVRIVDDGTGMTGADISEAMRLGTARSYDDADLGKFGLGLKTASLSQCQVVSVASRTDLRRASIEVRKLDLPRITRVDRWEIIHPSASDQPEVLTAPLKNSTGTVVLWENLDRVLNRRDPWGGWAQRHLMKLAEQLELHLGMVFCKFITGEARGGRKLTITVNGNEVEPWDPFVRTEPKGEPLPEREFEIGGGLVRLRPFVLPSQRDFSSDPSWRRASGPRQWNQQQGFYIFRADRMIQSGGWSRMRAVDEHTKLARAALEFWPDLDDEFEINISKMRVKLPEELREKLTGPIGQLIKRAQEKYRGGERLSRTRQPGRPTAAGIRATGQQAGNGTDGGAAGAAVAGLGGDADPWEGPQAGGNDGSVMTPNAGNLAVSNVQGGATCGSGPGTAGTAASTKPDAGGTGTGTAPSTVVTGRHIAAALQRAAERVRQGGALALIRDEVRRSEPEAARDLGW